MKRIDIILICILLGVCGFIAYSYYRNTEGFTDTKTTMAKAKKDTDNALLTVMSHMKKVSAHIMSPTNWIERFELMSLSPVELARRYINSKDNNRVNGKT